MKKLTRIMFWFLLLSSGLTGTIVSFGQNKKTPSFKQADKLTAARSLTIGDKVPDITINRIINYSRPTARLSDFKNKIIIIDFWGTTCSSCILALPKLDSLQKVYKDKIQILTVTNYDAEEKVMQTLHRYTKTRDITLPVILNDKTLKKFFPHTLISHVVWIGPDGVVGAITGTEYVTAPNIEEMVQKKRVDWPVKNDAFDFDYDKPLLSLSNQDLQQPSFQFYSAITSNLDGIDGTDRIVTDSVNNRVIRNHFNHTLLQLCDGSLSGSGTGFIDPNKLVLRVKDRSRFIRGNEYLSKWMRKNTYNYSIALPLGLSENETREIIKADLTRWLLVMGFTVKNENDTYIITERGM